MPSQWDDLGDFDKAQMIAFEQARGTMAAYEEQVAEQKREADRATREVKRGRRRA